MAVDSAARRRFIEGMHAFCRANGFDGVDYDWEHPSGSEELALYAALIAETKEVFGADMLVTVAQAGWQDIGEKAYQSVDRIHLMAYDHAFPQATLAKATADVGALIAWGCPPEKIALGMPFYGRDRDRQAKTYAELIAAGEEVVADQIDGFAFNGKETLTAKVQLVKQRGLAGVMVWEVGQDATDPGLSLWGHLVQQVRSDETEPRPNAGRR